MKKRRFRLSQKLFFIVGLVLLLQFFITWVVGNVFVEDMYISVKQNELLLSYKKAVSIYEDGDMEVFDEWAAELLDQNTRVTVFEENTGFLAYTTSSYFQKRATLFRLPFEIERQIIYDTRQMRIDLNGREFMYSTFLELYGNQTDNSGETQLYLLGVGKDTFFLLETPLEPIRSSAMLAVRLSLLSGIAALCAGLIFAAILAFFITRPILQIKRTAGSIANLDFSKHLNIKRNDEIGDLGESINQMSKKLSAYTTDLKTANEQLSRDIKERLQAETAQKQLVSNISHELKTPLALISGYAEGLAFVGSEEERKEYCEVILDESQRMTRLIQKLLNLAKLQSGSDFNPEKVDLSGLYEDMLSNWALPASEKTIEIQKDIDSFIVVKAEMSACEQVFNNFMSNAFRHVGGEPAIICVSLKMRGDRARLSVYNSGATIPEHELGKIWESFYRLDEGRNREGGEVGLGLSIVKAHMTKHKTAYGVENAENGVIFWAEFVSEPIEKDMF